MTTDQPRPKSVDPFEALGLAALRNAPLSVAKPSEIGKFPMARGRFLEPRDGVIVVENLQVPGRRVDIAVGAAVEAFFLHDGEVYHFKTRVLDMDLPVPLNDTVVVRAMTIAAPKEIGKGNRRTIYRQSFASVRPPVDVGVWAVPLGVLTPEQADLHADHVASLSADLPTGTVLEDAVEGYRVERGAVEHRGPAPAETLTHPIGNLILDQVRPIMKTEPHWKGEVADASEFGLGLTVQRIVYSRLKVFQPLAVRFKLPDFAQPLEFLFEIRRVQGLRATDARIGGVMLINSLSQSEVRSARELARFTLQLQRDRVRKMRDAG